ncbi:MAG: 4Fe-4S binding protein [Desulfobacterales bacterium]
MSKGMSETGYLSDEELDNGPGIPSEGRRRKGPVAVIECIQDIPCNPCEASCPEGAIQVGEDITNLPHLLEEKCIGCQSCLPPCPGQAIFLVDESSTEGIARVTMPYEFLPLPEKEETVIALDRAGQKLGDATVIRVRKTDKMDHTALVTIEVPKEWSMRTRAFQLKR